MAKKMIRIAPSLLACDFLNLEKELNRIKKAKADWIHLDIMDGHFVDNISFGFPILNKVACYPIFKDVHLMISDPMHYVHRFIDSGADLITFHIEALKYKKDVRELIDIIHSYNRCAGISIKPNTDIDKVLPFIKDLDVVLVMSVEPGFGGQEFLPSAIDKIKALRQYIDEHDYECLIEVDGGINDKNAPLLKDAGADVLVSGSYLFKNDMKEAIKKLR